MSEQTHHSDSRILNRRTLERDQRRLAEVLQPGMRVLDVGCGTGAITAGIARAVGPGGAVVGVDPDASLLAEARRNHGHIPNLRFVEGSILETAFAAEFDVVAAARTLQWIRSPEDALRKMQGAARKGGWVVVLDYNQAQNSWEPQPPPAFRVFYQAYLDWRTANSWDNQLAEKLPDIFLRIGLEKIEVFLEDEITNRGEPAFDQARHLGPYSIESIGPKILEAGFLTQTELSSSARAMEHWIAAGMQSQTLVLRAVRGRVG